VLLQHLEDPLLLGHLLLQLLHLQGETLGLGDRIFPLSSGLLQPAQTSLVDRDLVAMSVQAGQRSRGDADLVHALLLAHPARRGGLSQETRKLPRRQAHCVQLAHVELARREAGPRPASQIVQR
jgi:hypothetical protein